jgi:hypothetical protein
MNNDPYNTLNKLFYDSIHDWKSYDVDLSSQNSFVDIVDTKESCQNPHLPLELLTPAYIPFWYNN